LFPVAPGKTRTLAPLGLPQKSFLRLFLLALGIRLLCLATYMVAYPTQWRVTDFNAWEIGNTLSIFSYFPWTRPQFTILPQREYGHGLGMPVGSILWAGLMWLMGEASGRTMQVLVLVQSVPSALSVGFCWLIARYLGLRMRGLSPNTAAVAGLVLCFWPESLLRLTEPWYFVWQELGVALLIWLGLRWCDRTTLPTGSALGAVGGIVALINVNPIPIFAVAIAAPLLERRFFSAPQWRAAMLCAGVAILASLHGFVRIIAVFGRLYPVRSNASFELVQGNNPKDCIRERVDTV
jgi:hypothetical protein